MDKKNNYSIKENNEIKEKQIKEKKTIYKDYNCSNTHNNNKTKEINNNIYIFSKDINLLKKEKGKNNNFCSIKIFRNKKLIKYVLLMNIIIDISSKINRHKIFLFNSSEIMLKINKIGTNNILFYRDINNVYPCPSFIYLNNELQNLEDCTKININAPESSVKLIWNNPLNSIRCLFCSCPYIEEIKFLNFDTSLLTDMTALFEHCYSLTSVDVSNLNIKNVKFIGEMF